jgi:hypothetical protein
MRRYVGPTPPVYPFLASAYLVVGLAAANGAELIDPAELYWPLLISLLMATGAWLLSRLITQDRDRRALLTLFAVVAFGVFGRGTALLAGWPPLAEFGTDTVALPLTIIVLVGSIDLVNRSRYSFSQTSRYLNIVAAILLLWSGGQYLYNSRSTQVAVPMRALEGSDSVIAAAGKGRPHFFFIVLDKYTGPQSLRTNYGFDDTRFLQSLELKGFVVPRTAHANYNHTFLALAAMLNWQYLDTLAATLGRRNQSWRAAYPLIEDNRVARALKQDGYKFIFFPTAFAATAHNGYADQELPNPAAVTQEFTFVWLNTTILPPVLGIVCRYFPCSTGSIPYAPESASLLDWKFQKIPELAKSTVPVFVLAHLAVPHEPYIYDSRCRHRIPYWPDRDNGAQEARVKAAYVAQIRCTNMKVERLVDDILKNARGQTIIVLQSDHGHGRLGHNQPPLEKASPSQVAERTDIFAAYYLPGAPKDLIYDSIGPVNAVRAIMRHYYALPLPPLPDHMFWSSSRYPYAFTRIR